jgi:hypothetical protein
MNSASDSARDNGPPILPLTQAEVTAVRQLISDARHAEYRRSLNEAREIEDRFAHPSYRNTGSSTTVAPPLATDMLTPFTAGLLAMAVVCAGVYPLLRNAK